ncbi:MAG: hypothetical protein M3N39_03810, partial [Pseudomonadota bacterium]|nr:hypothetical protein [Pseudomonadota bacterium]
AEAIAILDRTIGLWPGKNYLFRTRIRVALSHGRYQDGLRLITDPSMDLPAEERAAWSAALAALMSNDPARRDAAAGALERVTREPSRNDPFPVMALGALGRNAEAIAVAERLIQRLGPSVMRVLFEPPLAQARHEPAFGKLVERLGVASYWRKSGHKPDFCEAADAPDLCRSLG